MTQHSKACRYYFISSIVLGIMIMSYPFIKNIEGFNADTLFWTIGTIHLIAIAILRLKDMNEAKEESIEIESEEKQEVDQNIDFATEVSEPVKAEVKHVIPPKPKLRMENPSIKPIPIEFEGKEDQEETLHTIPVVGLSEKVKAEKKQTLPPKPKLMMKTPTIEPISKQEMKE